MKKKIQYILLPSVLLTFGCTKTQFDEYETDNGSANFSKFISLGDSYTQGLQDGGLHNEQNQQSNSYPAIIAGQMNTSFVQPLVTGAGSGYFHLEFINGEIEVIKAYDYQSTANDPNAIGYDPSFLTWANTSIKYNNLAVGGLNVRNIVDITPAEHIYFAGGSTPASLSWNAQPGEPITPYGRFLDWGSSGNEKDYVVHIKESNATFFTNWLGINDALSWAKEGGDDLSGAGIQTSASEFRNNYDSVLTIFNELGAQGVCATIPDLLEFPYFTTVTLDVLGKDVWIKEGLDTTIIRKATNSDLILLTAISELENGKGDFQSNPLPHQVVLDVNEVNMVNNHINSLNAEIRASASAHNYTVVDMNSYMKDLTSGMTFDGVDFNTKFIEGGAFSLDGLHPNTKGYAIVANEFIRIINQTYGSSLRTVSVANYKGIIFP